MNRKKEMEKFKMKKSYYLAYGSNLNMAQMAFRCPEAKLIGKAVINDWMLLFTRNARGSGAYLTIKPCKGKSVPVAIWEVSPSDVVSLDLYEGFPSFYYKREFTLRVKAKGRMRNVKAFAYIMNDAAVPGIPSENYIHTCAQGYHDLNFDSNILVEAVRASCEAIIGKDD